MDVVYSQIAEQVDRTSATWGYNERLDRTCFRFNGLKLCRGFEQYLYLFWQRSELDFKYNHKCKLSNRFKYTGQNWRRQYNGRLIFQTADRHLQRLNQMEQQTMIGAVAISDDGTKSIAAQSTGKVFVYNGSSWSDKLQEEQVEAGQPLLRLRNKSCGCLCAGDIYTSSNSGTMGDKWTVGNSFRNWREVESNTDGTRVFAAIRDNPANYGSCLKQCSEFGVFPHRNSVLWFYLFHKKFLKESNGSDSRFSSGGFLKYC